MVLIAGRTRQDIRQAVGYNLGVLFVGTLTSNGSTTTAVDTAVRGGDNTHNGKWWRGTSSTNEGITVQVDDYTESSNQLTFQEAITSTLSGDTYELWNRQFNPDRIDDFINQGIIDVTGLAFDPEEDETLFFDGKTSRFGIPSNIAMIRDVMYRRTVDSIRIHDFDSLFDEATDADFTQTLDTEDKKQGNSSLRQVVAEAASAGDFVSDSIASTDLRRMTHVEGLVKSTVTLVANDYVLHLDDGAVQADGTDQESLIVPATIAANTWTFFRIALGNPALDSAIASVGLEYNVDRGALTVWFDDLIAVDLDSAIWEVLPRHLWSVDQQAGDLILNQSGVRHHHSIHHNFGHHRGGRDGVRPSYGPMKLVGGDEPALLTSDASNSEVDPRYLTAYATGRAAAMVGGEHRSQATYYLGRAARMEQQFPVLQNVRMVK